MFNLECYISYVRPDSNSNSSSNVLKVHQVFDISDDNFLIRNPSYITNIITLYVEHIVIYIYILKSSL